ncbi:MAG: hypothetical protein ACU0BF_01105 [Paracoccaceae bacterium]
MKALAVVALMGLGACVAPVDQAEIARLEQARAAEAAAEARARAARQAALNAPAPLPAPAQVTSAPLPSGGTASRVPVIDVVGQGQPITDLTPGAPLPPLDQDLVDTPAALPPTPGAVAPTGDVISLPPAPGSDRPLTITLPPSNGLGGGGGGGGSTLDDEAEDASLRTPSATGALPPVFREASVELIAPTALPQRTGAEGPNVVAYALSTSHSVGDAVHRRASILPTEGRAARACAGFASDDAAQREFLARGGPARDPLTLDPDGDGFACGWNPAVWRG